MRYTLATVTVAVIGLLAAATAAPAPAQSLTDRPAITVTDFEYGTVAAQIAADKKTRKRLAKMGIRDGGELAEALGVGAADLIVEKLVEAGSFRVLERKQLAAIQQEQQLGALESGSVEAPGRVVRARYLVSGSVTRLGFEEKALGGAAGRAASEIALYGLGAKKNRTHVHLTARVIDTETGEIVASFTGQGESGKGWGLTVFGLGGGGFGGVTAGSSNIRETAIGEATERAAQMVVERVAQLRFGPAGEAAAAGPAAREEAAAEPPSP